jgi:hypothetical protein
MQQPRRLSCCLLANDRTLSLIQGRILTPRTAGSAITTSNPSRNTHLLNLSK